MINRKEFIQNNLLSMINKIFNMLINIGGMAILARLLTPSDFGIFAVIISMQALFQPLLDMGLGPVYIKKEILSENFQNTIFSINLLLAIINIILLLFTVIILNNLYNIENLFYMTCIFAISIFFTSLGLNIAFSFSRDKKFKELFIVSTCASIGSLIISIVFAYLDFQSWSLIIKAVSFSIITFLMYLYFYKNFNFTIVSREIIKQYLYELKFGLAILINRIVIGISNSIDKLIIAKFYGPSLLGNYTNANQIISMPDSILRISLTSVTFSYLERFDLQTKRQYYFKYYGSIFIISSILPLILYLYGNTIILFLLGEQWINAANYVSILSIYSLAMIIRGILTIISMHENSMKQINYWNIVMTCLILFSLFIQAIYHVELNFILMVISYELLIGWVLYLFYIISKIYYYRGI